MTVRLSFTLLAALCVLAVPLCGVASADAATSREYQVKAAFLYNFTQFVAWPQDAFDGPESPIVIGVAGDNPFGLSLEQAVRDKVVNGRRMAVRYYPNAAAVGRCHVLFVSASEKHNVTELLKRAGDAALTVGDFEGFAAAGGIFRFFTEGNKVRFEVNLDAARRSRLKISSKLLKMAKIYEP